eukprot:TRINITY_DN26456_c0_g1_i1.p1 TRINITY_DN26456_c0_g1~~TRINITY_DN26456_c0_g1_i1.p1  ORF type:complete len:247 (-),score=14.77 TRINITY_DN26456_c0_g1_i1:364-1104(-)
MSFLLFGPRAISKFASLMCVCFLFSKYFSFAARKGESSFQHVKDQNSKATALENVNATGLNGLFLIVRIVNASIDGSYRGGIASRLASALNIGRIVGFKHNSYVKVEYVKAREYDARARKNKLISSVSQQTLAVPNNGFAKFSDQPTLDFQDLELCGSECTNYLKFTFYVDEKDPRESETYETLPEFWVSQRTSQFRQATPVAVPGGEVWYQLCSGETTKDETHCRNNIQNSPNGERLELMSTLGH